ncbi:RagB/SusD family nutrient uptake outer membrane protein [Arachidicoccus rhizosphaerae]|nr:RagB/SusD family nutrient uptake outer membrane protein [Arachidicoccus rhizosphaerae]
MELKQIFKVIFMKLNNFFILFVILSCVISSSCKKFLSKKQNASSVVPSKLSDLQALMDNGYSVYSVTPSYMEASSDEYFLSDDLYNSFYINAQKIYTWAKFLSQEGSANDWGTVYNGVYYANLVLDLIKDINRNEQNEGEWDNIKGSALLYRAYDFLNLLWNYAKAYDSNDGSNDYGIVLRMTSNFNEKSVRATNYDSYMQVIRDAKEAIPLLPDYPLISLRPSKGAAYGLLARCYLSMRDYNSAKLYADSCLQLYNRLIDFNEDEDIVGSIENSAPFIQYNKETIFYSSMNSNYDIFTQVGFIDTTILKLYEPGDLRLTAYFSDNGYGYKFFKASYSNNIYSNFTGIATDEVLLIRAECCIRTGEIQKGLNDINTLLVKRYKTGTFTDLKDLSASEALDRVLQERRKELIMRGTRWMDIKRLNKEGRSINLKRVIDHNTFSLEPNSNFYALPLPDDLITISGIPPNEP